MFGRPRRARHASKPREKSGSADSDEGTEPSSTPAKPGAPSGRAWLFCIPMQVGPATEYARSRRHWLFQILFLQVVMWLVRAVVLRDTVATLWMAAVIVLGGYAYHHQMNISYVCAWGLMCFVNGIFDTILLCVGLGTGESAEHSLVRVFLVLAYMMGATLARHMYIDYALHENVPVKEWSRICDPFGRFTSMVSAEPKEFLPCQMQPQPSYGTASAVGGAQVDRDEGPAAAAMRGDAEAGQAGVPGEDGSKLQPTSDNPFMTGPLSSADLP